MIGSAVLYLCALKTSSLSFWNWIGFRLKIAARLVYLYRDYILLKDVRYNKQTKVFDCLSWKSYRNSLNVCSRFSSVLIWIDGMQSNSMWISPHSIASIKYWIKFASYHSIFFLLTWGATLGKASTDVQHWQYNNFNYSIELYSMNCKNRFSICIWNVYRFIDWMVDERNRIVGMKFNQKPMLVYSSHCLSN